MKQTLILLLFILSSCFSVSAQDSLVYSNDYKLTWEDFKGNPVISDSAGARIANTIQMKIEKVSIWSGVTTFSAWGVMYPSKSWVKQEYTDDYTLNHEQLHFDIAELVARRLERKINQMKINGGNKVKATKVFNEYVEMLHEMQIAYDLETSGANNKEEQSRWDEKIRKELKELEQQATTTSKSR